MNLYVFIVLAFIGRSVKSQLSTQGCANVSVVQNFDASKYVGTWYDLQAVAPMLDVAVANKFPIIKCAKGVYSVNPDKSLRVEYTGFDPEKQKTERAIVRANTPNKSEPGKLVVIYLLGLLPIRFNYWILDTDYTSYSLGYSCTTLPTGERIEVALILSRGKTLDSKIVERLRNKLASYGLDVSKTQEIVQDC